MEVRAVAEREDLGEMAVWHGNLRPKGESW